MAVYLCVIGNNLASFYDFLYDFRRCGIFCVLFYSLISKCALYIIGHYTFFNLIIVSE
jgi:hypothetical protein